ncbi:PilC/PilY family type IV pilus protein [Salinisphaera sp. G21_0]|uniref:PilC/PilY family type IV pilus protein n=1 Tax=Salinisphaera sp. G21_0 TaxID=2821094 RepID=UPI001ADAC52A|nr:PilC/PilY family type IV pilus protein [Salinisphaera sp. G21_0]MBO9480727.1 VWA domain-containing protein [Salinisphaera sp. G21_0]
MILSCELAANDIDLFVADLPTGAQPNVMLIMDTSASMGTRNLECGGVFGFCQYSGPSRMDIAKRVAKDFISDAQNINISVMRFNYDEGGRVIFASEDIDTGRQGAMNAIDSLSPNGFSPMAETLYEAYLYFSGQQTKFAWNPLGIDFNAYSIPGLQYRSPIVTECQKNNIILLTDGAPSYDTSADVDIERKVAGKTMPDHLHHDCHQCLNEIIWYIANQDIHSGFNGDQNVFLSVIGFGEMDQWSSDVLANSVSAGNGKFYRAEDASQLSQAFADIMVRVNSESTSFAAPTVPVNAFNSLESTDELYYTVFAPSSGPDWTGNLKRYRLGDDNQIYDANGNLAIDPVTGFFSDNAQSFWSAAPDGKVVTAGGAASHLDPERPVYTNLSGDRDVELSSGSNRVHEHNVPSFPDGTLGVAGVFKKMTLLQWARGLDMDDDDGDGVFFEPRFSMGDPIHTQPVIVTYNPWGGNGNVDQTVFFTTNDGFLHAVDASSGYTAFSFIPKKLLGNLRMYREGTVRPAISGAPTSDSQCVWNYQVPGACVPARYCEYRFQWGDLNLSESCRVIPPTPTNDDECDWDWSKSRCAHPEYCKWHYNGNLVGDSVCDIRPRHEWPPPPPEPDPGRAKVYGMDGPITAFFRDWNGDGNITDGHGHAYLFLTMRRGGSNIYSLDVTNRNAPKLRWVIKGDVDSNNKADDDPSRNPDFPELGQTWSKAQLTKVKWQGSERYVLLFGGGYDEDADQQVKIEENDIGRAIYMVDAYTGEMLWHAGKNGKLSIPEMKYSIPADLTLVDINQDGLTDYFYAVDIGGQVFRVDINHDNAGSWNFANGGLIAQLAGQSEVDARRFFEAPTVAIDSKREYLNIAIGSGTRPDPMNTVVEDRMYVLRDRNIFNKPTTYRYVNGGVITEWSLYDATSNIIQHGKQWDKNAALGSLSGAAGWFMRLEDPGEKILGRASLINGMLLFTSFVPQVSSNSCSPGVGLNYFYAVNIEDGTSVLNVSVIENMGSHGRRMILSNRSMSPQPSVISKGGEMKVCIGSECLVGQDRRLEPANLKRIKRSFWRENR